MPPIEPPTTASHRSMPRASATAASASTWSRMVIRGKRLPHGRRSAAREPGPVLPWQPPRTLIAMMQCSSVSSGAPEPMTPGHQPALGCPEPAGPTT